MYMGMYMWVQMPVETRRWHHILWSWSWLVFVSQQPWVLGTKLESSTTAVQALNYQTISPGVFGVGGQGRYFVYQVWPPLSWFNKDKRAIKLYHLRIKKQNKSFVFNECPFKNLILFWNKLGNNYVYICNMFFCKILNGLFILWFLAIILS